MEKILKDRLNHLKSNFKEMTNVKLSKIINTTKVNMLKAKIEEIEWLLNKINDGKKI